MDTSEQVGIETFSNTKRRRRTVEEKAPNRRRDIRGRCVSSARSAEARGQRQPGFFTGARSIVKEDWVKVGPSNLLPVAVSEIPSNKSGQVRCVSSRCILGAMEIKLAEGASFASRAVSKQKHCAPCWNVLLG